MKKIGTLILAIGMIVVFAGCKASTDAPESKAELTGILITTLPTKKDYHIGDTLDLTGMVVTANYNDGSTKTLGATEYEVTGFDSTDFVNEQLITVTHNDKTDTFKIRVLFSWLETPVQLPAGTNGTYGTEGTYVLFGVWPQDVVPEADVAGLALDENATTTIERGYLKFVFGSDGNYYVKHESKWYKVMPIKWRVFDETYDVDGDTGTATGKLLVAENILTANVPYYEDYENNRKIDEKTVYPNNYMHSQIRAFLNGLTYIGYDTSSSSNVEKTQWNGKGFLQTAFTSEAAAKIETTKVDNSEDSTTNYNTTNGIIPKSTTYACDPTDDKIFLLSEYEVTKYSKSTEAYNSYGTGNSRIRVTTDFAKANNAYQSTTNGYGGYWWLRSPYCDYSYIARDVYDDGYAYSYYFYYVSDTTDGVVPALSISF